MCSRVEVNDGALYLDLCWLTPVHKYDVLATVNAGRYITPDEYATSDVTGASGLGPVTGVSTEQENANMALRP